MGSYVRKIRWMDCIINLILIVTGVIGVRILLQIFVVSSYYIPSESMEPTLLPGDYVLVNKLAYGARLFNLNAAAERKTFTMYRTWGYDTVKRNDVIVFNNPYPNTRKRMEFDLMEYYVKRCVALPGDSFEISKGRYKVRGCQQNLGNITQQDRVWYISTYGKRKISGLNMHAHPKWQIIGWSILEYGPLYIPRQGDVLPIDVRHYWIYRQLIEWESHTSLTLKEDSTIWMDNKPITEYTFKHNYYFMVGDNVANSDDSRYWGLVPDDFIAGKVCGIWKSKAPGTEKLRWDRIGSLCILPFADRQTIKSENYIIPYTGKGVCERIKRS